MTPSVTAPGVTPPLVMPLSETATLTAFRLLYNDTWIFHIFARLCPYFLSLKVTLVRLRMSENTPNLFYSVDTYNSFLCIRAVFVRFSLGGGSEFRLAMTDRATIAGMEVAKLVSGV